jgi:hypothetical protein
MHTKGNIVRLQLREVYAQFLSAYYPQEVTQFCIDGCSPNRPAPVVTAGFRHRPKSLCLICQSLLKKFRSNCRERIALIILECRPFRCDRCGSGQLERKYGQTLARCFVCKQVKQLTEAVQFFHRVKVPEDRLLFFVALRSGIDFNAKQFSDTLQKSSNTGIELQSKIDLVVLQKLKSEKRLLLP